MCEIDATNVVKILKSFQSFKIYICIFQYIVMYSFWVKAHYIVQKMLSQILFFETMQFSTFIASQY
jgi:hypothetical protein